MLPTHAAAGPTLTRGGGSKGDGFMADQSEIRRAGVIMAGGSGERFWPLSRRQRPKQLLNLTSETETMLGEAVSRLGPVIPPEHVYIVTGKHLVAPIREAGVGIPDENVIAEPCKRNTSGALAYAAAHLVAKYGLPADKISMAITTADHLVSDGGKFGEAVQVALDAAEERDALATFGVVPTRPETGYGYIQIPADAEAPDGSPVYPVTAFHEKPNRQRAEDFMASGQYFWNSGMFFWKVSAFLAELDTARPEFAKATLAMIDAMRAGDQARVDAVFEGLENVSIDYALMEHAKNVVVVRADFPWDDIGAWPALDRTYKRDEHGNVIVGSPIVVESEDCIVYNEVGPEAMAVGVIGVEDLVVVVTQDAVLVMPKDRAQDVRRVVKELKDRQAKQL
jgi:mannose-1-phosphate guanylyltransferase